jgi:hypothetical protein
LLSRAGIGVVGGSAPAVVARLRRLAARLPALGEDGAWLAGVLRQYLDPFGGGSLDGAAGLAPAAGAEHWRTAARRALRDEAIRALAGYFPGLSRADCAEQIWKLLDRYRASRWHVDRAGSTMPDAYLGTSRAQLHAALTAGDGRVPGASRIRQLLTTGSPVFIGTKSDESCGHGTDRTTDRRDRQHR